MFILPENGLTQLNSSVRCILFEHFSNVYKFESMTMTLLPYLLKIIINNLTSLLGGIIFKLI
jgi:hypothetical protein